MDTRPKHRLRNYVCKMSVATTVTAAKAATAMAADRGQREAAGEDPRRQDHRDLMYSMTRYDVLRYDCLPPLQSCTRNTHECVNGHTDEQTSAESMCLCAFTLNACSCSMVLHLHGSILRAHHSNWSCACLQ